MADLHKHILVTGYTNFNPTEDFVDDLNDWFYRLVEKVDMKIHIDPVSKYCYDEGNEGLSGLVCITTSHGSIHFWPSYFKADLYSCSDFTVEQVVEMLEEFSLTSLHYTLVDRTDDSHPTLESGEINYINGRIISWVRSAPAKHTSLKVCIQTSAQALLSWLDRTAAAMKRK